MKSYETKMPPFVDALAFCDAASPTAIRKQNREEMAESLNLPSDLNAIFYYGN
jgi:hypothetical protein